MKIDGIHIDGFGVWHDKNWGPLDPGLNVFHGPNETGKSTLMAFIRSVLFGFERRGAPQRYEPVNGGSHGGWLDLLVGDTHIRVHRKPGRHVRGTVTVYTGDASSDEAALERLLEGTTRTLYHNVFAFGLEELEHFHTLQESEISSHLSGAALGIGASRWTSVQKDLEARQSAIFLPRGHNSSINVAFKELEAVRDDLNRTEHQPQDYLSAHEARARLAGELARLEDQVAEVTRKIDVYAARIKSRPLLEKRTRLEARLRELPAVHHFPEGGVERLKILSQQGDAFNAERARIENDMEVQRLRRIAVRSAFDSNEFARRSQILEILKNLSPRMEAARSIRAAHSERCDAIAQEKKTLVASLESMMPPSMFAFSLFVVLLWAGVIGLAMTGHDYLGVVLGVVSLAPLFWRRQRLTQTAAFEVKIVECCIRQDACIADLRMTENEILQMEAEVRKLIGQSEVSVGEIKARTEELEHLGRLNDEIRSLDEAFTRTEAELASNARQIDNAAQAVTDLLKEASVSTQAEFLEKAEAFKQRRQLLLDLEKIPVETAEPGFLFDMLPDEAAFEAAQRELNSLEQRLIDARHETGRVEERISMMEKSEERSRALSRQETILARIDEAAEQWAILTLCRALLDETRKVYETERQPEVLRHASMFFTLMTDGRYVRIITPLDGGTLEVERADGVRLSPQTLSRGAAEQLYLAMRLALIREYANHVDPLPVILDDIFVNFDPDRSRTSIRAVCELCSTHQVLLFTCHPHLVEEVRRIAPSANVISLA